MYRRAAEATLRRTIGSVAADDDWFLKEGTTAESVKDALVGEEFTAARRRGKLLILDTSADVRLGLRFGMTGRLIVDDGAAIERLEYSSGRNEPAWDRFAVAFDDGGSMRIRDPRRLGGVMLDPDEASLGDDVFGISSRVLADRVFIGDVAIKARLLDQGRIAGIGNLIADETLWRSGIDPARPAGAVTAKDIRRFEKHLKQTLADLTAGGGSHSGQLQEQRQRDGVCPRDGEPLQRRTIGGRTTYSCPRHQR